MAWPGRKDLSYLAAIDRIARLREALDNSQSLLVAMLVERRPESEIEAQIVENRGALDRPAHTQRPPQKE